MEDIAYTAHNIGTHTHCHRDDNEDDNGDGAIESAQHQ